MKYNACSDEVRELAQAIVERRTKDIQRMVRDYAIGVGLSDAMRTHSSMATFKDSYFAWTTGISAMDCYYQSLSLNKIAESKIWWWIAHNAFRLSMSYMALLRCVFGYDKERCKKTNIETQFIKEN